MQVLTDGDGDLALYAKEYFPEAIHTVDVIHVIEYVYKAGECLYDEGSAELKEWVPRIQEMAQEARQMHVVMNNCYRDHAVNNARSLWGFLDEE